MVVTATFGDIWASWAGPEQMLSFTMCFQYFDPVLLDRNRSGDEKKTSAVEVIHLIHMFFFRICNL